VKQDEPAEFALWLQRANDPSVTEEQRRECRALMDGYLRARMREAFRTAVAASSPRRSPALDI
jgi:hypothetical protein